MQNQPPKPIEPGIGSQGNTPDDARVDAHGAATKTQRIDRWLWYARFFKTRTLAAKFVSSKTIRLTRDETVTRIEKPAVAIRPGDVLTFTRNERPMIIEIVICGNRRGPATEAATLYNDLSPPPPPKAVREPSPFEREKGAGRPTKKDRREIQYLRDKDLD